MLTSLNSALPSPYHRMISSHVAWKCTGDMTELHRIKLWLISDSVWDLVVGLKIHRIYHGYTPRYWRQTCTHIHDRSVPVSWVQVWSQVLSLVPTPIPVAVIPVGYEQEGGAKVRAIQARAQCTWWCALYCCICSSHWGQGWDGKGMVVVVVIIIRVCHQPLPEVWGWGRDVIIVIRTARACCCCVVRHIASHCLRCEDNITKTVKIWYSITYLCTCSQQYISPSFWYTCR